jgi:hypothetical protein
MFRVVIVTRRANRACFSTKALTAEEIKAELQKIESFRKHVVLSHLSCAQTLLRHEHVSLLHLVVRRVAWRLNQGTKVAGLTTSQTLDARRSTVAGTCSVVAGHETQQWQAQRSTVAGLEARLWQARARLWQQRHLVLAIEPAKPSLLVGVHLLLIWGRLVSSVPTAWAGYLE